MTQLKGSLAPCHLDVLDDSSIESGAKMIDEQYGRLDILINNAGIVVYPKTSMRETLRETFETNTFGQAAVTEAFTPLLVKSPKPRLIFLTTSLASLTYAADPDWITYKRPFPEYRASKAALNMLVIWYHKELGAKGVKVHAVDPGALRTSLLRDYTDLPPVPSNHVPGRPEDGAEVVLGVVTGKRDGEVGRVVNKSQVLPW